MASGLLVELVCCLLADLVTYDALQACIMTMMVMMTMTMMMMLMMVMMTQIMVACLLAGLMTYGA